MSKMINISISWIILIVIAVILCLMLFRKKETVIDRTGEIKALEKVSESIARERDIYREWKDELNAELEKKDSLLQTQVKQTIIKYEKIPVTVRNYSNDELRRAVENY